MRRDRKEKKRKEKRTVKFVLYRERLFFYQRVVTINYNDPISTYNNIGTTNNEKFRVRQKLNQYLTLLYNFRLRIQ
jgi:hypothetical protein